MKLLFNNETNEDLEYLIDDIENVLIIGLELEDIKEDLEISLQSQIIKPLES